MENNKQYFTPDIEDIRVGYECEWLLNNGLKHEWIPVVADAIAAEMIEKAQQFGTQFFRTLYLTKEKLESEGYNSIGNNRYIHPDSPDVTIYYKSPNTKMWIMIPEYNSETGEKRLANLFCGFCKDINTFRYIKKLLNIK